MRTKNAPPLIKIDRNVPIPEGARHACEYPFKKMTPGDSFYTEKGPAIMRTICNNKKRKIGIRKKFVIRAEKKGSRVWRVK